MVKALKRWPQHVVQSQARNNLSRRTREALERAPVPKAGILLPVHKGCHVLGYLQCDATISCARRCRGLRLHDLHHFPVLAWGGLFLSFNYRGRALFFFKNAVFSVEGGSAAWGRPAGRSCPPLAAGAARPAGGSTARARPRSGRSRGPAPARALRSRRLEC